MTTEIQSLVNTLVDMLEQGESVGHNATDEQIAEFERKESAGRQAIADIGVGLLTDIRRIADSLETMARAQSRPGLFTRDEQHG